MIASCHGHGNSDDLSLSFEFVCDEDIHYFTDLLDSDCVIAPRTKLSQVPDALLGMTILHISRGSPNHPSKEYTIFFKEKRTLFLGVHDRGTVTEPVGWSLTDLVITLDDDPSHRFIIYRRTFESHEEIDVPRNHGKLGFLYAKPSVLIF